MSNENTSCILNSLVDGNVQVITQAPETVALVCSRQQAALRQQAAKLLSPRRRSFRLQLQAVAHHLARVRPQAIQQLALCR